MSCSGETIDYKSDAPVRMCKVFYCWHERAENDDLFCECHKNNESFNDV